MTGGLFFAGNRDTIPRKTGREGTYEKDRQLRKFHGAGGASAGGHPAGDGRLPHFLLPVRQGSRGHRHISVGRGGAGAGDSRSAAGQPQLPAAEGAASVKARIAAPLCQRTESGKAAGQHKHGNDRAAQTQNSASHVGQTQNGQHNGEYLCSCDGGCRQEER